jgi:hypothetical protein
VAPTLVVGMLAIPLAAIVAVWLVGREAAPWAGGLVALSPIYALACREAAPEALLVPSLLLALWLLAVLERHGLRPLAVAFGLAAGGLAACGVAPFAAAAILLLGFAASRRNRRTAAFIGAAVALLVVAMAVLVGVARSPLDYGAVPPSMPETTHEAVARCTGASFTRVLGIEYQLVVSQARYVLPLTALFVALMARGALQLTGRVRVLLVAGALLPFALGATLAAITGRVTPLQAHRLLAAMPFVALLMAGGLASLHGTLAWAAGTAVGGTLVAFLALALSSAP